MLGRPMMAKALAKNHFRSFCANVFLSLFFPLSLSLSLSQSHAQTTNQLFSNQRIQFSLSWSFHSAFSFSLFLKIFAFCHFFKRTVSRKLSSREKTSRGKEYFFKNWSSKTNFLTLKTNFRKKGDLMTKMSSRQPREDFGLDDSSDLEDSWAAESVMFDASPVSRKFFYIPALPLASTRWLWLTSSSLCPLF